MNRLLAAVALAAMTPLAAWLPRVGQGFDPQSHGQAAWTPQYDYFVCTSAPIPSATPFANFDYAAVLASGIAAANACGQFQNFAFRNNKLYYIELLAGC